MGMPVQHGRETWRSRLWRYVDQKKIKTFAFQLKFQRPNYTQSQLPKTTCNGRPKF